MKDWVKIKIPRELTSLGSLRPLPRRKGETPKAHLIRNKKRAEKLRCRIDRLIKKYRKLIDRLPDRLEKLQRKKKKFYQFCIFYLETEVGKIDPDSPFGLTNDPKRRDYQLKLLACNINWYRNISEHKKLLKQKRKEYTYGRGGNNFPTEVMRKKFDEDVLKFQKNFSTKMQALIEKVKHHGEMLNTELKKLEDRADKAGFFLDLPRVNPPKWAI